MKYIVVVNNNFEYVYLAHPPGQAHIYESVWLDDKLFKMEEVDRLLLGGRSFVEYNLRIISSHEINQEVFYLCEQHKD